MELGKRGEARLARGAPGASPLLLTDGLGEVETIPERRLLRPSHILFLFFFCITAEMQYHFVLI